MKLGLHRVCLFAFIFAASLSAYSVYVVSNEKRQKELDSLTSVTALSQEQATLVSDSLDDIQPIVARLAEEIYQGTVSIDDLESRLSTDLDNNKWMFGLGIAFEPYRVNEEDRLWSRYFVSGEDDVTRAAVVDYDYTQFDTDWYRKPLLYGAHWNEPYFGQASETLVAEFGTPFWLPGRDRAEDDPDGVVFGSLSIEKIRKLLQFDHDLISYYMLVSKQGRFVAHPIETHVLTGKTVFEQAWKHGDSALNSMAVHAVAGDRGHIAYTDPETKVNSWMVYQPIEAAGWSLVVVVDKASMVEPDEMRQHWFVAILQLLISVMLLAVFVALRWSVAPHPHSLGISMLVSVIIVIGVVGLWRTAEIYPRIVNSEELKLVSANVLNKFVTDQEFIAEENFLSPPKFIKTGVYLQSLEFEGANNVLVSGYIWQHYKKGEHRGLERGFVLPEANTPTIEEAYRDFYDEEDPGCAETEALDRDCEELVGWYISALMRQEFDYSHYPLDSQQVWLRMWHKAYRDNIILVPDIESYAAPNPKATPGVQHGFVLPGWQITDSWFSINDQIFSTSFGARNVHGIQHKPELFYNVNIQREFLNPFVSRIIPVMVISILMFLIVLISTKSSKVASWLGFSASDVVLGLSALFFVIGLSHTDLRQFLSSSKIMYFEYLYFVIYVMLLYVAVSSIYIAKQDVIEGRDENFLTKNFYWPVMSLTFFLVTFWVFY